MAVVGEGRSQGGDFGMFPAIVPADLFAVSVNLVTVGADMLRGKVNQLPNLQTNAALAVNLTFELGEGGADRRKGKR